MKKKLLLLTLPLLLAGCSKQAEQDFELNVDGSLSIMTPTGAPAVVFSAFIQDAKYQPSSNPQTIIAQMVKEQVDIAVLPTNAGVQQIVAKGLNYKIASTITFGNLFIVSSGSDDDAVMDETDDIYLFGKNNVPHKIFQAVHGFTVSDDHFKNTSADIKTMIKSGDAYDYALISEPDLTSLLLEGTSVNVFENVQTAYKNKFNQQEIYQASIFVKNGLNKESLDSYLNAVERYVQKISSEPDYLNKILEVDPTAESVLIIDIRAAIESIKNGNKLGIGYKKAYEHKEEIDTFLSIFGMSKTDEAIYYK